MKTNSYQYVRGPHIRYAMIAMSIGFGSVISVIGIFIAVLLVWP